MELDCRFTRLEPAVAISKELMGIAMELCRCSEFLMTLPGMLIKAEEKEKAQSLFTSNHGTLISSISSNSKRTLARKKTDQETSSMGCGFQISL